MLGKEGLGHWVGVVLQLGMGELDWIVGGGSLFFFMFSFVVYLKFH